MSDPGPLGMPSLIAGRYRPIRELGRGGMGAVYEAEHVNTGERVAVKTMLVGARDAEFIERFRREARAFAKIGGDNVVRIIDADIAPELNGAPFLVMELLNGSDLSRLLEKEGRLSPSVVAKYLSQAGAAIERAHAAGLIHRDLKPENIFVHNTVEGRDVVKVLDFGIAKSFEGTVLTKAGALVGSPAYMAPEQARGAPHEICAQTDVWAFGMIAVELLTGEPYWIASNVMQLFAKILTEPMGLPRARWKFLPRGFDAWFARSCAREIPLRWPSVREQLNELRVALRGEDTSFEFDATDVAVLSRRAAIRAAPSHRISAAPAPAKRAEPPTPAAATPAPPPQSMTQPDVGTAVGTPASDEPAPHAPSELSTRAAVARSVFFVIIVASGAVVAAQIAHRVQRTPPPKPEAPTSAPVSIDSLPPPLPELPSAEPASSRPAATSTALPSAATPIAAPSPSSDCSRPFWFDAAGVKHYRPECIVIDPATGMSKNPYR